MSNIDRFKKNSNLPKKYIEDLTVEEQSRKNMPTYRSLENGLKEANKLVDDIILKKYLYQLTDLEIFPLADDLKKISDIRIFKITEMVYQNNEYSTYKFASVFNAVQNLNCGVFIIVDSHKEKTDFYMGVRSLDDNRTTKSLKDTLKNALVGQFPGVKTEDLIDPVAEKFLKNIATRNIASVSCIGKNKDEKFNDNKTFIQGLEKMVLAMQGQEYTAIILAKSTPMNQLEETRKYYETIYSQLTPFTNMQMSYGTNTALSISDAFSYGVTKGSSYSNTKSKQGGTSYTEGTSENKSITKTDKVGNINKSLATAALGITSLVTAPLAGGTSLLVASGLGLGQVAINSYTPKSNTTGEGKNRGYSINHSESYGETNTTNENTTENQTNTKGISKGTSDNMQLTLQNKSLINILERIDLQLKRIDECESIGMWECASYFISDSQETTEMAAGTYKALMKGEKSGVETSAINLWSRKNQKQLPLLREYITNFIHPVFKYSSNFGIIPVTASSLVSSNELAIQMGLPRKSVCGFPVIEHADFGKEVIQYDSKFNVKYFCIGKVFNMGSETDTEVNLDINSLTMHTFVTGSTGSGKSNTVYEILNQLRSLYDIPFLVVEPAKGEYKNVFGKFADVNVYGTNPKKSPLLRINPFRFPEEVHVLEHLDRLVEIFNVCWPMYAAMPAILKEAMEKAYVAVGWDLGTSKNSKGNKYPNFADLLEQIDNIINESKYSADSKGDYSGALLTRVRSLTNGLNGLIFCNDDLKDDDLFDKNVIIDLSRIGSIETKSLIMGLLVMKLNEYRMTSGKINSPLSHITVLEEAHNLLKRTSTEQSSETANILGKSVELLTNSIAEMRTYGEGFIIADQSPSLLDMAVIRNTNTKIILRLPDKCDRELVGYAAGLNEEQIDELSKLKRGVAAIYQNDWVEPVLVQVSKCNISEKAYNFTGVIIKNDYKNIRTQLVKFLLQGRVNEKLEFSIEEIEDGLDLLKLSSLNYEFVEEQILEFKDNKKIDIWKDENFRRLSRRITDMLEVRAKVENCVLTAIDDNELTDMLWKIVRELVDDPSEFLMIALSQCFMKDMSIQKNESETRQKIYTKWYNFIQRSYGI